MTEGLQDLLAADAIIFDMDGTLIDSVDIHAEAWKRAFAAFGFDFDLWALRSQIGKGGDELMPMFLSEAEIKRQGKAIESYRAGLIHREFLQLIRGFPDVPELFRALKARGKRVVIGSSSKKTELSIFKTIAGINGLTDGETTSDDAARSKPHPDIFQAALDQLGLPPDRVIAIGDSPHDVEAAKRAGIKAIGVICGGFPELDLRKTGAVAIFRDPQHILEAVKGTPR